MVKLAILSIITHNNSFFKLNQLLGLIHSGRFLKSYSSSVLSLFSVSTFLFINHFIKAGIKIRSPNKALIFFWFKIGIKIKKTNNMHVIARIVPNSPLENPAGLRLKSSLYPRYRNNAKMDKMMIVSISIFRVG